LESIDESNITFLVASPSLLNQFLSKKEVGNRLAKVKTVLSTGSKLSGHLKESFLKKTNKIIFNYYGLTETTGFCIGETLDSYQLSGNTIGKAIDCIVQIVDTNDLEVPVETTGELRIYSYGNSFGYYQDDTVFNGIQKWFYTGDLAKRNASGIIELIGRKKDFIKNARSEIVYFQEIEDALMPLSFIIDTGILCYFENETENLALFVEIDQSNLIEESPIQVIKKELITKIGLSKVPTFIKIINKIPRSSHGKLNRMDLEKHL
jgi:acyl-coenzyme A synthetase/AMP-(fatty) acid ligase